MLIYTVKRFGMALLVMLAVSVVTFTLLRLSGDPAAAMAGESATAEDIEYVRKHYGFDRPLAVQYWDWGANALRGDFGVSIYLKQPVAQIILDTDRTALTIAVIGQAFPSFFFALILIYLFGVALRWLPITGTDTWLHYVMPAVTLGYYATPAIMRLTRAGMIEVLGSDYIRTARAKGMLPGIVLFKHALRNAIIPVVSLSAVQLGFMLGGSIVIETIFSMHGIGRLAWQSIQRSDFERGVVSHGH